MRRSGRTSCPAASSSGWRSPGPWPTGRRLLIADEPTAQLDSVNARQIMKLLRAVADAEGVSVLVATHDQEVLAAADRVLRISDGVVAPAVPAG